MNEIILSTHILPEPLLGLVNADKVRVSQCEGAVIMTPIKEKIDYIGKLYGSCADSGLTVDQFLRWTHEEKEMDSE